MRLQYMSPRLYAEARHCKPMPASPQSCNGLTAMRLLQVSYIVIMPALDYNDYTIMLVLGPWSSTGKVGKHTIK